MKKLLFLILTACTIESYTMEDDLVKKFYQDKAKAFHTLLRKHDTMNVMHLSPADRKLVKDYTQQKTDTLLSSSIINGCFLGLSVLGGSASYLTYKALPFLATSKDQLNNARDKAFACMVGCGVVGIFCGIKAVLLEKEIDANAALLNRFSNDEKEKNN